jgi:hypothetical protein
MWVNISSQENGKVVERIFFQIYISQTGSLDFKLTYDLIVKLNIVYLYVLHLGINLIQSKHGLNLVFSGKKKKKEM